MTQWVGAAMPRKEDRRMLLGRGRFVGDLTRPGLLHAAFVRSPHAHARITRIDPAAALRAAGVEQVLTAKSLGDPYLLAILERDEFVPTEMPILAGDKVRFVGEPVAVVIADDAYRAEDAAELVEVDWDPQPAVASIETAIAAGAPRLHDHGNCLVDLLMFDDERLPQIFATAKATVSATFRSARVAALPLEGRACLAEWDDRDDQLVMHVSTQVPHQVRSGVAQALQMPERSIRVIAPDVGGGFGLKCVVGREEVAVAAAALRLRRPVRWIEDRQENLTAAFHGHEQRYQVRAAFDAEGRILGLDAEVDCDTGAYSVFPFTCAVEPLMAATELPGVYKVPAYRARGRAIATNKAPAAPYRGVSRPQIVLVMERLMEKAAAALGLGPLQVRRANLIGKHEFPYTGVNQVTYDEGSYRESLDLAERIVTEKAWAAERDMLRKAGQRAGIGYACFSERTAYGTSAMAVRRMRMTPGYDTALVRMDPTGEVIVTTGTCGHGQGHETTFAQIVADRLGVHPDQVRLRQGDTDLASYGWGTWGSRSVVIGGGAARPGRGRGGRTAAQDRRQPAGGQPGRHRARRGPGPRPRRRHRGDSDLRAGQAGPFPGPPAGRGPALRAGGPGHVRPARHRLQRLPRGHGGDRPGHLCYPAAPLPGRRGLRRGHQPDGGRRAGARRRHAGRGGRAARAGPLRLRRPAGQRHLDGLPGAHRSGNVRRGHRPPADALQVQRDGREGDGGGRHDRRPGRRPGCHQRRDVRHRRALRPHPGAAAGRERRAQRSRGYPMKDLHDIRLTVNGREHELVVEARRTLADMLRHDLGYTGTHLGCEHGICGACTVILDGAPVRACLIFGVQADGAEVRTVEGLADGEQLSDLQQAFSDHHALQCGFCTPGFLMLAEAYLAEDATQLTEEQARELVAANLCRCTGYQGIIEAVLATARARRSREPGGRKPADQA